VRKLNKPIESSGSIGFSFTYGHHYMKNPLIKEKNYNELYNPDVQKLFIEHFLSDIEVYKIVHPQFNGEIFDARLSASVDFIRGFYTKHNDLPSREIIKAKFGIVFNQIIATDANNKHQIKEFHEFFAYKIMEGAMMQSIRLIEKGDNAGIDALMLQAKEARMANTQSPFKIMRPSDTASIPAPTYIIRPWLMADTLTAIFGPSQGFKSFFCIEAALCIATGKPFNGYPVRKAPVMYIAAEGETKLAMRLDAWRAAHPDVVVEDDFFTVIAQPISILNPAQVDILIAWIRSEGQRIGRKIELLFIDTLSQCIAGADEDGAASASLACAEMIRIRRETGCTVVFVHHTGKDVSRGMRGSSAYFANVDGAIEIERDGKAGEAIQMTATATVKKMKDGFMGQAIPFGCVVTKIPRLHGSEIDASLVLDFFMEKVTDSVKEDRQNAKRKQRTDEHRKLIADLFKDVNQTISVRQVAKSIWYDNSAGYEKVADAFEFESHVYVINGNGDLMTLIRYPTVGTKYGEISRVK
jgi:hypothetical protein